MIYVVDVFLYVWLHTWVDVTNWISLFDSTSSIIPLHIVFIQKYFYWIYCLISKCTYKQYISTPMLHATPAYIIPRTSQIFPHFLCFALQLICSYIQGYFNGAGPIIWYKYSSQIHRAIIVKCIKTTHSEIMCIFRGTYYRYWIVLNFQTSSQCYHENQIVVYFNK